MHQPSAMGSSARRSTEAEPSHGPAPGDARKAHRTPQWCGGRWRPE